MAATVKTQEELQVEAKALFSLIQVQSIPANPGYYAWVRDHEERFGCEIGDSPQAAIANMREWIEFKLDVDLTEVG